MVLITKNSAAIMHQYLQCTFKLLPAIASYVTFSMKIQSCGLEPVT